MNETIWELEDSLIEKMRASGLEVPSRDQMLEEYRQSNSYKEKMRMGASLARKAHEKWEKVVLESLK